MGGSHRQHAGGGPEQSKVEDQTDSIARAVDGAQPARAVSDHGGQPVGRIDEKNHGQALDARGDESRSLNHAPNPDANGPRKAVAVARSWGEYSAPAIRTCAFLIAAFGIYLLLSWRESSSGRVALVETTQWRVWKATAALAQATALALCVSGSVRLARLSTPRPRGGVIALHVGFALLFTVLTIIFVNQILGPDRAWPVPYMHLRLNLVTIVGTVAAVPWIALVWLAHSSLSDEHLHSFDELQASWSLITSCTLTFTAFVVVAVLPSGALRNLWLAGATSDDERSQRATEFASTHVLLFGCLYLVLIAVIVIPLIAAWRSAAWRLVDHTYPPAPTTSKDHQESRTRLEVLLSLDVPLLRNPLTVLSVLTPVLTAALAAFIPELVKK